MLPILKFSLYCVQFKTGAFSVKLNWGIKENMTLL